MCVKVAVETEYSSLTDFNTVWHREIQQELLMEMHFWCSLNSSKGIVKEMRKSNDESLALASYHNRLIMHIALGSREPW